MATYKNARGALVTGGVVIYTVPASTVAKVTLIQVTNIDGTNDADADIYWTDSSNSNVATYLCKVATVAAKDALGVVSGGLILEAGDKLYGVASADGDLQCSVSYIEETV